MNPIDNFNSYYASYNSVGYQDSYDTAYGNYTPEPKPNFPPPPNQTKPMRRFPFPANKKVKAVTSATKTYHCEICGISCPGEAPYQMHIAGKKHAAKVKASQGESNKPACPPAVQQGAQLECTVCSMNFLDMLSYTMHINSGKHQKKVAYQETLRLQASKDPSCYCAVCDLVLQPGIMDMHIQGSKHQRKANGGEATPQHGNNLSLVKGLVSSGQLSMQGCQLCQKQWSQPEHAILHFHSHQHLDAVHTYEAPFSCDLCHVRTTSKELLEVHLNGIKHAVRLYRGQEPQGPLKEKILALRARKPAPWSMKRSSADLPENNEEGASDGSEKKKPKEDSVDNSLVAS